MGSVSTAPSYRKNVYKTGRKLGVAGPYNSLICPLEGPEAGLHLGRPGLLPSMPTLQLEPPAQGPGEEGGASLPQVPTPPCHFSPKALTHFFSFLVIEFNNSRDSQPIHHGSRGARSHLRSHSQEGRAGAPRRAAAAALTTALGWTRPRNLTPRAAHLRNGLARGR